MANKTSKRVLQFLVVLFAIASIVIWQRYSRLTRHENSGKNTASFRPAISDANRPLLASNQPPPIALSSVNSNSSTNSISSAKQVDDLIADARTAMSRSAYDKAIPLLRQALEQGLQTEKRRAVMTMLVEAMVRTQDYAGAEILCKELLAGASSDLERATDSVRLAQLYIVQKNYSAAEQVLEQVSFVGTNQLFRTQIQHAQLRLWQSQPGRLATAVTNLEQRVAIDPSDQASLELLGTVYLKVQRDYVKAKPVYERMLTLDPTNAALQNTLISICQETKDYGQARTIYERYLETHPAEADGIRFQIAALYLQSGKGDDAVAYADQYLGGKDTTPERLQLAARIYENAGRLDDSARLLQQAQAGVTDNQKRAELRFQTVDLLTRQKKYSEAEQSIRQIIADFGADTNIKARANQEMFRLYQLQGKTGGLNL